MSNILNETRMSPAALARHLQARDASRPIHVSTIIRWITRGIGGERLQAVRLGGRWVTSLEALDRFVARLTAGTAASATNPPAAAEAAQDRHADQTLSSVQW